MNAASLFLSIKGMVLQSQAKGPKMANRPLHPTACGVG